MDGDRIDMEEIETTFVALVEAHDLARVAILAVDGTPAPVPAALPLPPDRFLEGGNALNLVLAEERVAVIHAWAEMVDVGMAYIEAHFTDHPGVGVPSWYFDLRPRYGVCAVVLIPDDPDIDLDLAIPTAPPGLPPRIARMAKDEFSTIIAIDDQVTTMLGWEPDDVIGRPGLEFVHPDDHEVAISSWVEMVGTPGHSYGTRQRHRHRDGHWVWVQAVNHNKLDDEGCVRTDIIDISEEMAALENLRDRERLLDRLAEALPVGLFQVDLDRRLTYGNARLVDILGRDALGEHLIAATLEINPDDSVAFEAAVDTVIGFGHPVDIEVRFRHGDGGERRGALIFRPLTDDHGVITGAIGTVADVTESATMRQELERRATFDQLTGCYNRGSILDELERVLIDQRPGAGVAVVFVDLDDFKQINDEMGHAAGDTVLADFAHRLRGGTRSGDLTGRLGGDEFLIVCPGVRSSDEAVRIAQRIKDAVSGTSRVGARQIHQQVSVGVAWTSTVIPADVLVARADHAMYESKRQNRGQPVYAAIA